MLRLILGKPFYFLASANSGLTKWTSECWTTDQKNKSTRQWWVAKVCFRIIYTVHEQAKCEIIRIKCNQGTKLSTYTMVSKCIELYWGFSIHGSTCALRARVQYVNVLCLHPTQLVHACSSQNPAQKVAAWISYVQKKSCDFRPTYLL